MREQLCSVKGETTNGSFLFTKDRVNRGPAVMGSKFVFRRSLLALIVAAFVLQTAYIWESLAFQPHQPACGTPEDALIVYGGGRWRMGRVMAGLAWFKQGCASALVYSDAPDDLPYVLAALPNGPAKSHMLFVPALNTADNAEKCVAFAKARGWRRLILVTSWYHLPRARLLTWIYTAGSGLTIQAVASEPVPRAWYRDGQFWREYPKLWGSFGRVLTGVGVKS